MTIAFRSADRALRAAATGAALSAAAGAAFAQQAAPHAKPAFDTGDTAWMLICCVLVVLMVVPGIALFYAGMVRRKNALATMAMVLGSAAVVSLAWVAAGYSLAFSGLDPLIGDARQFMLERLSFTQMGAHPMAPGIPEPVFILFQMAFAMVTVALIYGAVVERMKFMPAMAFAVLWLLLAYAPVARWIWHPEGWLHTLGHMDYAGGTVVHIAAGVAGLVLAAVTGTRRGYGRESMPPHNLLLTVTGAGMLWVGWFGFNGGSAMQASPQATMSVLVTQVAAAAGVLGWLACELTIRGRVTLLGLASGLLAGMIAVTPASGYILPNAAITIGLVSSICCYFSVTVLKARLGCDDSLDVFGLHGIAGLVGTVLTGAFQTERPDTTQQMLVQAGGALAVALYVAAVTFVIAWLLRFTTGLRVHAQAELEGLDRRQHGETLTA